MTRRASGHLEQPPSGGFRVDVYAGTDRLTGRRPYRRTVKIEQQAGIVLGKLLEQVPEGRQPETGVTVAELLRQYMVATQLDRSTRHSHEGYIRRTILPALGPMELRKIRGPVLDMLYARLHRCGDLACSAKPFIEHSASTSVAHAAPSTATSFPGLFKAVRAVWDQLATAASPEGRNPAIYRDAGRAIFLALML